LCVGLAALLGLAPAPAPAGTDKLTKRQITKVPAKKLFGAMRVAAPLKPRAIGFYSKGCLAGAVKLHETGPAWQAMRLSRNRNWGHPALVKLVKRLAKEAKAHDGWPGLLVGDLAQPRGGPMLSGHASHQIGLDADIWLTPMPDRVLTRKEREKKSAISVIKSRTKVNPKIWTAAHAKLIRRAARYSEVARIFVHPPIKGELCRWSKGQKNRGWLKKVRPYYGHHYHFHIRMKCPTGASGCRDQNPPAPKDGTGCGGELAYWYSDKPWAPPKPKKAEKPKPKPKPRRQITLARLPKACRAVLTAR
jgi:penicillin-insensitive murein endopeptidase